MDLIKVILTSLLSVVTLFVIAKLVGHKQIAQLEFFDYITGITLGSIGAELATELEEPWKPFTSMVVYCVIAISLSIITNKFPRTRKYINGSPTIIMNKGKLYRENMKKAKLDLSEFMVLCREQGYFDLSGIESAVFEADGKLSILPTCDTRPISAEDLNIKAKPEHISTEIIMDGRILEGNLTRRGLDLAWLKKQLKAQGYKNAREIYLATCSDDNTLTVYPMS